MNQFHKGHTCSKNWVSKLCLTLLLFSTTLTKAQSVDPGVPSEVGLPESMGAMGDSITAGFFANFSRRNANLAWVETWFIVRSLTAGALFQLDGLERKDLSWSVGHNKTGQVLSHARRLAALDPSHELKVYNAAVSGDEVNDVLTAQLPRLNQFARSKLGQEYPDFVTIFIGANDVCADSMEGTTSVQDFYNRLDRIVGEIVSKSPRSRVLVSGLPDIESLRRVAHGARLWGWGPLKTCDDVWNLAKVCPTLTTISDPVVREQVKQRVDDYNLAMQDVVERHNATAGDRIHFVADTFAIPFNKDHLSMDCFHPNASGQNLISEVTFKHTWWPTSHHFDTELKQKMAMKSRCEMELKRAEMALESQSEPAPMSETCWQWFKKPESSRTIGRVKYFKKD